MKRQKIAILIICLAALGAKADPVGIAEPKPAAAVKFLALFDQLRAAEEANTRGQHQPVKFEFSDAEIDEYMRYSLKASPRPGVESVTVKVFPENYISTYTVIDFDAVERWKPGTVPAILRPVLNGKKSIWVDYRIQAHDSKIGFSVEKAYYQNVHIPAFLVNEVIKIVAARQPEKYDTSAPMPIPFGLKTMWTTEHVMHGQN
jgi:hypothetical protein